jgi:nicotinate-nucleotide adenylyltransferase
MRVAFFGGSFDPPHIAHVMAVVHLRSLFEFERILVVPVLEHPFDKHLTPFDHRRRMCALAMGWVPATDISPVERELVTPSLTVRTLRHLRQTHPDFELRLVIGADVLDEVHKWHAFDAVTKLAPPLVLGRVGHERPEAGPQMLPEVSSSKVREWLRQRESPEFQSRLREVVPAAVLRYIDEHDLYRPGSR